MMSLQSAMMLLFVIQTDCCRSTCLATIQTWVSCPSLLRPLLMLQKIPQHFTL